MKVLISRKDLKDTTSGVPKKVLQEVQFFKKLNFDSYAIAETINISMIQEFGGIALKTFKWPISGFFRRKFYQKQVDRWIKKNHPDLVIGHGDILNQDVLFIHNCVHLAHELIKKEPLPLDHEVGLIHSDILKNGSFKLLICNSNLMKNDLMARFKINPSKVVVIYPEINLAKFNLNNTDEIRAHFRKQFHINENDFVIGLITSGNFKKRNLGLLIDSYIELKKKYSHLKLFVAGGNVEAEFELQARGYEVIFAPPIIDVKNYYQLIDVFVLPAIIEEFGRSVLEAMYCKKPVITTKSVGASEIFEGKSRALIMDKTEKVELMTLLQKLIDSKDLVNEISELNHETAKKYSAEIQNKKFADTLSQFNILKG